MSIFARLFGGNQPAVDVAPPPPPRQPPMEQFEAYVHWTLRYGPEFEGIRRSFFPNSIDEFVEVSALKLAQEFQSISDLIPLYERYEVLSRSYETELLPVVWRHGGARSCPKDLRFKAIEVYIRLTFMNQMLRAADALAPPLTYEFVTPLQI